MISNAAQGDGRSAASATGRRSAGGNEGAGLTMQADAVSNIPNCKAQMKEESGGDSCPGVGDGKKTKLE